MQSIDFTGLADWHGIFHEQLLELIAIGADRKLGAGIHLHAGARFQAHAALHLLAHLHADGFRVVLDQFEQAHGLVGLALHWSADVEHVRQTRSGRVHESQQVESFESSV